MRVALFHNRDAQRGGEDAAFDLEIELLRKAGCVVHAFTVDSGEVRGPVAILRTALSARSSSRMAERVARFVVQHPVDVAHVHNFFPLLTPAVHETLFMLAFPSCKRFTTIGWPARTGAFCATVAIARSASCAGPGTRCVTVVGGARASRRRCGPTRLA